MNNPQSPSLQNAVNTGKVKLPYFDYLLALLKEGNAQQQRVASKTAMLETATIELLSKLRLINYYVYGFQKQWQCLPGGE